MPMNCHVRAARDFLLQHRTAYEVAAAGFRWPELPVYNFATDCSTVSPRRTRTASPCG